MNFRYRQSLCSMVYLLIGLAAHNSFAQVSGASSINLEDALVQRVLQYEFALNSQLSPQVGLCVDELMGGTWILPDDTSAEIRPSEALRLRQSIETCAVATSGENSRVVAGLRAMTEHQLKLKVGLEKSLPDSRTCLKNNHSSVDLDACITKAMGKPPSQAGWKYWQSLLEHSSIQ